MAVHILLEEARNRRALAKERVFRDRNNPLDSFDDAKLYRIFRFTRNGITFLMDLLSEDLQPATNRSKAISAPVQIFTALGYFGQDANVSCTGMMTGVSEASVSRILHRVTEALCRRRGDFIRFPVSDRRIQRVQKGFHRIAGFPGVVSVVDCTHVKLDGSNYGENEYVFVNRKKDHSINVQLMCDHNYRITNVSARWPGSTHDSRIMKNSQIAQQFYRGERDGLILGDSGYALEPWLLTPFIRPSSPAQQAYNNAHQSTRARIEQVNGQLKNKFPILRRGVRVDPGFACDIIVACCVLFRIAQVLKEPHLDRWVNIDPEVTEAITEASLDGAAKRAQIVRNFFT